MPRWRLRTALAAIALLSLFLALGVHLKRRRDGYMQRVLVHAREADRLERAIITDPSLTTEAANSRFRLVHWHDYAATYSYNAASRPWISFQADPSRPYCICK